MSMVSPDFRRTFALDRILSLKVLNEHFLPKRLDPQDELHDSFGSIIDGEPVEIILHFDAEIKPHILRKKWHQSQQNKELQDGRLEVSFQVNGFEGIKQWIYRWLPCVEIIAPKSLRTEVTRDLASVIQRNRMSSSSKTKRNSTSD